MSEKDEKGRKQMSFKTALFVNIGYGIARAIVILMVFQFHNGGFVDLVPFFTVF